MGKEIIRGNDIDISVTVKDADTGLGENLSSATSIRVCMVDKDDGEALDKRYPSVNEIQKVSFSAVPDAGDFKLSHEGNETSAIPFGASNTDVQTALNALASLSAVTVSGDFSSGFTVTFAGADGAQDQPLLVAADNTLLSGPDSVVVTVSEETKGFPQGITPTALSSGRFTVNLSAEDTLELETGIGQDLEVQWVIAGKTRSKVAESAVDIRDGLCL